MAAVVSHAMRRFPTTPPDDLYSHYRVRTEGSARSRPSGSGGGGGAGEVPTGESSLSRSMRYADPWLYGSVRGPPSGLLLAPALLLCVCADPPGTARRHSSGVCRKCGGARLRDAAAKFGTVRCYPAPAAHRVPPRAGTVRAAPSSASRPSILPQTHAPDPYDLMRRSRLAVTESTVAVPSRSSGAGEARSHSASRGKGKSGGTETSGGGSGGASVSSPTGRRSILECDINPYELMSSEPPSSIKANPTIKATPTTPAIGKDAGITLVNGQRIRVRPPQQVGQEYEDVQVQSRRPQVPPPIHQPSRMAPTLQPSRVAPSQPPRSPPGHLGPGKDTQQTREGLQCNGGDDVPVVKNIEPLTPSPISTKKLPSSSIEKDTDSNKFKSILKKPTTSTPTFGDSTSNGSVDVSGVSHQSPSPSRKTGSQFYLPMPTMARKKVQFAVESNNEVMSEEDDKDRKSKKEDIYERCKPTGYSSGGEESEMQQIKKKTKNIEEIVDSGAEDGGSSSSMEDEATVSPKRECKLRRSISERSAQESTRVVFHDTMALRARHPRGDTRSAFSDQDLLRLDGLTQRPRKISPSTTRPLHPPPPPPQPKDTKQIVSASNMESKVDTMEMSQRTINGQREIEVTKKKGRTENVASINSKAVEDAVIPDNREPARKKKSNIVQVDAKKNGNKNIEDLEAKEFKKGSNLASIEKLDNENVYEKVNVRKTVWFGGNPGITCDEDEGDKTIDLSKSNKEKSCENSHSAKINLEKENSIASNRPSHVEKITNGDNSKSVKVQEKMPEIDHASVKTKEIKHDTPPCAPPRKRSNNKQPQINIIQATSSPTTQTVRVQSPTQIDPPDTPTSNKTIVKITPSPTALHKIQIRNEFSENINCHNISVLESPQRKTSILINGDDCYSTVNVNDDVPLYQSSVVVKDYGSSEATITTSTTSRKSSSVYITGRFEEIPNIMSTPEADSHKFCNGNSTKNVSTKTDFYEGTYKSCNGNGVSKVVSKVEATSEKSPSQQNGKRSTGSQDALTKDYVNMRLEKTIQRTNGDSRHPIERFSEDNIPSTELLKELLRDPVEAVRRNLVPHVCGKSDVPRRQRDKKFFRSSLLGEALAESPQEDERSVNGDASLGSYESVGDDVSEHSASTQYEPVDGGSECYTDHSNRSSVTEEELANRTKFYELLADSAAVEVSENEDHHYESIRMNSDPIYEEIEVPPPLPANPPPTTLMDDLNLDKEFTTRSIFEGASKYDILSYLVDAKERGIVPEDTYTFNFNNGGVSVEEETKEQFPRICHMGSTVSDSSEDNSLVTHLNSPLLDDKSPFQKTAEVERNDSGVGSETSKSSLSKYRIRQEPSVTCEDCDSPVDSQAENEPLICRKCIKKRSERKEIITEIVETEEKYSRDLQIILEEFYQPMLVAGLLTPEQLSAIFLNVEELLENSQALAERLRDAVEIAIENGDEDLLTVNIGKLFLEAAPMLHAFETYCVRQGAASLLLASLEKDKELLRIFLRVSQMENTLLRRMNLNSFLMVPVQRVTKYPLLLARLYKVTPAHHGTREHLREAQHKIELHLNHMNSETKDIPSKLWRRIGSSSGRRSSSEMDLVNIKLRKIAVDVLEWNHDEAKFALEGKLLFTQPTDNNWRKGRTIKLTPVNALLVTNGKPSTNRGDKTEDNNLIFSRHSNIREAALLLVRDKNGRYSLLREPLYLDRCIVAADAAWQSYFEVQELGKDTFIFKAEDDDQTRTWYRQLQQHAQGMGAWRKRRNALANIMINGMGLRS